MATKLTNDLTLTAEALTARADQRRRAATTLAGRCSTDDRAGKDIRPAALLVTRELAQAADLDRIAAALTDGSMTLMHRPTPAPAKVTRAKAHRKTPAPPPAGILDDCPFIPEADLDPQQIITAADLTPDHDPTEPDDGGIIIDFDPDKD